MFPLPSPLLTVGAGGGGGGGGSDPNFSSTVLIINPTGAQNSTTFTDASPIARTITTVGAAKVDNTSTAFPLGTVLCTTRGSDYLSMADSADFDFSGAGDFTMEVFWEPLDNSDHIIIGQGAAGNVGHNVGAVDAGNQHWYQHFNVGPGTISDSGFSPTTNSGYYLVWERAGTLYRMYRGGLTGTASMVASQTWTFTLDNSTSAFLIGSGWPGAGTHARIGGVRVTKGVARFNSNSGGTVPTLPFPTS